MVDSNPGLSTCILERIRLRALALQAQSDFYHDKLKFTHDSGFLLFYTMMFIFYWKGTFCAFELRRCLIHFPTRIIITSYVYVIYLFMYLFIYLSIYSYIVWPVDWLFGWLVETGTPTDWYSSNPTTLYRCKRAVVAASLSLGFWCLLRVVMVTSHDPHVLLETCYKCVRFTLVINNMWWLITIGIKYPNDRPGPPPPTDGMPL